MSWASNSVNENLLKTLSGEVDSDLHKISKDLETLAGREDLSAAQKLQLKDLIAKWKKYESSARDNIDVGKY